MGGRKKRSWGKRERLGKASLGGDTKSDQTYIGRVGGKRGSTTTDEKLQLSKRDRLREKTTRRQIKTV